jgi:translation initiation factor IF-3
MLLKLAESIKDVGAVEKAPSLEGRTMSMVLNPKTVKES